MLYKIVSNCDPACKQSHSQLCSAVVVTSSLKSGPAKEREIGHYKSLEEGRVTMRQSRFSEERIAFALK